MRFTVSTIIEITITLSNRNLESSVQNVRFCINAEENYVSLTVKKKYHEFIHADRQCQVDIFILYVNTINVACRHK